MDEPSRLGRRMLEQAPRRWFSTAARAALSCVLLLWILYTTPLHAIATTLARANLWLCAAGLAVSLVARIAAAERTLAVTRALRLPLSRWQTIETLFISNFYSLFSPGPVLSGAVTVYRYSHRGASIRGSLAALLISRAMECTAFLTLGAGALLVDDHAAPGGAIHRSLLSVAAAVLTTGVIAAVGIVLLARARTPPAQARLMRQSMLARAIASGTDLLQEVRGEVGRRLLRALLPAAAQAFLSAVALTIFAASLGVQVSLTSALWVSAAVYVAVLLPISVIGLGVREVTLIHSLATVGVSPGAAVAISVLLFADPLLNSLIGGVLQAISFARSAPTRAAMR
ncbi:MAG TPA: lysylphosphatidylglycerol synthase transmembrane domain-containing protein [Steroidobacteraceae bacterium]|nr:lysylphosphatidylglycerol synthase transmembrane domain-containing protein [Steroidobacteraceae bacterium]